MENLKKTRVRLKKNFYVNTIDFSKFTELENKLLFYPGKSL